MINTGDITITSLETITAFDIATGEYMFTLDELSTTTIANSEDKSDITGKGGRKLSSLKRNKAVTISGSNGLISGGMLATQVGGTFENKVTSVMYPEELTVTKTNEACTATTTYVATGTAGNEIGALYIKNTNNMLGAKFTQDAAVETGKFTYDPATKVITLFGDDFEDGQTIEVHYFRKIQADVLDNYSDHYSQKAELYIDAFGEDTCNNVFRIQFHVPKADYNGTFNITLGEDQAVHNFEAEALAGACGTRGLLWTYTVYGENTEDVA